MFDSSLRYVTASRRWMETFLRGNREVAGLPFYEVFGDIPRAWRTELSRVLEGEIVRVEDERWRPAHATSERHLRWEARPWLEQGSAQPGVLLFAQDITHDREHEAALERMRDAADAANRAKSEFLATMSHEIRTPMNGVLGFTQLLLDTPLDAEQREFARTIDASGRSLLALLNDILDYSKIEAGKLLVEVAPFDLPAIVDEVAALLSSQCHDKRLELLVDYSLDAPRALAGDAARVRQVLTNLVGNAIKFTARGHVLIEVRRDGDDTVLVNVRDTGIGIPADLQPSLFNKFVQADSTTTRRFGGTGLGLAICRQLVELMDGAIGVHSIEGRIDLLVPPARARRAGRGGTRAGGRRRRAARPPTAGGGRRRAESPHRAGPCRTLGHAPRGRRRCASRARALRAAVAAGRPFDVAVVDYLMPGMDGEQLARAIRADLDLARLPLVMLTSSAQRGELARMRGAGFDACLTKPLIRVSRLRDALLESLARHDGSAAPSRPPVPVPALPPVPTPGAVDGASVDPASSAEPAIDRPPGPSILLVEDHPVNRSLVLRVLGKLGYDADVAEDGAIAVEMASRCRYDADPDGLPAAATRRLRGHRRDPPRETGCDGGRRPIVALTAGAMLAERERCLASGMQGFLTKPLVPTELRQVLDRWAPAVRARTATPSGSAPGRHAVVAG
jgi:two-component system, sensor histidine kinase and response regulator